MNANVVSTKLISDLVPTGIMLNGEEVFLKNDRKVVIRGGAVISLPDNITTPTPRKDFRPQYRKVRSAWKPVVNPLAHVGKFDREKAAAAAEKARQEALVDPDKSGYGKKTNDPSRICPKGQGGSKGGKGATNPKVIERNARRAKRHSKR